VQWQVNTGSGYTGLSDTGVYSETATGTLTITGATQAMSGYQYEAVFTNSAGNATTTAATLTVETPTAPSVTTNPTSQTVNAGSTVTFTAAATGLPTPTVQWEVNTGSGYTALSDTGVYSGTATGTLTITGATQAMSGFQYEAVFTNSAGNATTTAVTLTVQTAPTVTTEPTDQTAIAGNTATFTAAASGTPTPTVQWEVNTGSGYTALADGGVYSGSGSATLTIAGATQAMNGYQYEAVFTNTVGHATTNAATLTVQTAPSVTTNPSDQTVNAGQNVTFAAAATGSPTPTVRWEVDTGSGFTPLTDGGVYSGSATGTLTITGVTQAMSGYQYEAVFSNGAGTPATTTAATLTVVYVSANPTALGTKNDTAAGFTIYNGTVGEAYTYTIESSGGGTNTVSGNGTLTSSVQNVTGIDVSKLSNGTLTYTVTLASSPTAPLTATATLGLAPSGYTITTSLSTYNLTTGKTAGFTVANATVGTTLDYIIAGSQYGYLTGYIAVTSTTQSVSGLDITSFSPGVITFLCKLVDAGGNTGLDKVASATLNTTVPAAFTVSASPATINASTATDTSFTFAGATSGDTYSYTVTSSGGTGSVSGSGSVTSPSQTVGGIDVSSLPVGTLTYSVTLTNSDGNITTEKTTADLASSLSGFTVAPDQSTINANAVNSTGFTLTGVEIGDTFTYTISGTPTVSGGASTVTGSGSVTSSPQDVTGIDLSNLADATVTFSVTMTDVAGHTGTPVTATATIDRAAPSAIALSTSVAPAGAALGTQVALLQTVGPQSAASYTYSFVSGAGSSDNGSFQISGNELLTNAIFSSTGQSSYSIRVRSTDVRGNSVEQQFLITLSNTDPITPTLTLSNNSIAAGSAGAAVGAFSMAAATGGVLGSQVDYTLVPGTGSDDNSSFQIVGNQLETSGALVSGRTYTVRVRSSSTFLISDAVQVDGTTGPNTFQVTLDPARLPGGGFAQLAADAGLITLSSDPTSGVWNPAVSENKEVHGSLAEPNYLGSYASFQSSLASATLSSLVGSSGIDLAANAAWAVVDGPGQYGVGVQVFTERAFTITVT